MTAVTPRWNRAALLASPLLHTVRPFIEALPADAFPDTGVLSALAQRFDVRNAEGLPIRFVTPTDEAKVAACDYEGRAYRTGEVLTRAHSWHDCFNALAWCAFPRAKAAINRAHMREIERQPDSRRSVARDVLTLFDEDGMVVAASDSTLIELVRNFRWKELFVSRRADVRAYMRFYIFGHALHEKALAPYRGITAKAIFLPVTPTFFEQPPMAQLATLDAAVGERIAEGAMLQSTATLQPLPILGVPDWHAQNESPDYYDDPWQFRPGRRRTANAQ